MQYMVQGTDGQEYGPVDFATLKSWVEQNRVLPETPILDQLSGVRGPARTVPGLFPGLGQGYAPSPTDVPPQAGEFGQSGSGQQGYGGQYQHPPSPYPRGGVQQSDSNIWPLIFVIGWCSLALLLFFVFNGIGIIIAGFTIFDGVKMKARGNKYGTLAIGLAAVTTLIIGIGWLLKLGGSS